MKVIRTPGDYHHLTTKSMDGFFALGIIFLIGILGFSEKTNRKT